MKEREIQRQIIRLFEAIGAEVWPTSQYQTRQLRYVRPGLPDLIILLPRGKGVLFYEVKAQTKARPEQEDFRRACEMAGAGYCIGGLEEAVAALQALGFTASDWKS